MANIIRIGTLAPKASPWGQIFTVWADAVSKRSNGQLELQFFYNGQQGDEGAMVNKLKNSQLDGLAVTAVGLGKLYKPILALHMPGIINTWAKLDAVREAMKGEFERGLSDAGVTLAGWGDVGAVRLMSKGFAIKTPDDIQGKHPYMWRDNSIKPVLYQTIGGITPVPLNVPEVLPNLNTGAVNIVYAPSLAAEQFLWTSKLDTITDTTVLMECGGIALSSKCVNALPADLKDILLETGGVATNALTKRIRAEDDAAFARIKGRMTLVTHSADESAKWNSLFKQVRQKLGQEGVFDPALIAKIEGLAK